MALLAQTEFTQAPEVCKGWKHHVLVVQVYSFLIRCRHGLRVVSFLDPFKCLRLHVA